VWHHPLSWSQFEPFAVDGDRELVGLKRDEVVDPVDLPICLAV
jgi:hypothetical protein